MIPFRRQLLLLLGCVLLSFAVIAYPLYVIRPFRYQGPRELAVALAVMRLIPVVEALTVLVALALLIWIWRTNRGVLKRVSAAVCCLVVLTFAAASRVNVYELMFHPLERPRFSAAAQSKLDGAEMVIAVGMNGSARAYPIRSISYHHIVNDDLGGVPIVATY